MGTLAPLAPLDHQVERDLKDNRDVMPWMETQETEALGVSQAQLDPRVCLVYLDYQEPPDPL